MKINENRLLLFFDTEFTDFKDMDLISIGIVAQNFLEFYAENADYESTWCNDFVKAVVLPKLQSAEHSMSYDKLKQKLHSWLSNLLTDYAQVVFVFDYAGDWFLLSDLLMDFSLKHRVKGQRDNFQEGIELYFKSNRAKRHHALHDARALLYGFNLKYEKVELLY